MDLVTILLVLAPTLLILVPLLSGRYLGEELIAKLVARATARPRRAPATDQDPGPAPATWSPRGTRLIAFSLDKRPPPTALLTQIQRLA